MITCPQCHSGNWDSLHVSPIRPEEDRFRCHNCGIQFTRYQATEYETDNERDNRQRKAIKQLRNAASNLFQEHGKERGTNRAIRQLLSSVSNYLEHGEAYKPQVIALAERLVSELRGE